MSFSETLLTRLVMGYFLFMQEMRYKHPGWGGKSNAELQILCDPLWRALSQEEKAKYKNLKKRAKRAELDQAVRERQAQEEKERQIKEFKLAKEKERQAEELKTQSLRMARGFMLLKQKKTKIVLLEMVSPSIVCIAPEIELGRVQKHLERFPRVKIEKSEKMKGTKGFCSFSGDGMLYRCEIISSDRRKVRTCWIRSDSYSDPALSMFRPLSVFLTMGTRRRMWTWMKSTSCQQVLRSSSLCSSRSRSGTWPE